MCISPFIIVFYTHTRQGGRSHLTNRVAQHVQGEGSCQQLQHSGQFLCASATNIAAQSCGSHPQDFRVSATGVHCIGPLGPTSHTYRSKTNHHRRAPYHRTMKNQGREGGKNLKCTTRFRDWSQLGINKLVHQCKVLDRSTCDQC